MDEAKKIVHWLLEQHLIACANYFPIRSSYWRKWVIEESDEIVSLLKTDHTKWEEAKTYIERVHPYEVPCIIKYDVEANDQYLQWIQSETQTI